MQVDTKSRQVEIEMESAELRSDQTPSIPMKQETQGIPNSQSFNVSQPFILFNINCNIYILSGSYCDIYTNLYNILDDHDTNQRTGEKIKTTSM